VRARGYQGESIATEFILSQGYTIIAKNVTYRRGEIDLVAEDHGVLAFVEVKYYKVDSLRDIHEAVDMKKQKSIIRAAERYIYTNRMFDKAVRFDVVLITHDAANTVVNVELHKDAFRVN
jgi:putative endonuclease